MIGQNYMTANPYGPWFLPLIAKNGVIVKSFAPMSSMTKRHLQWPKFNIKYNYNLF